MRLEDIKAYYLNKWKTYEDYPFGDIPVCYKLNGKVFAQIYPKQEDFKITLKCTADARCGLCRSAPLFMFLCFYFPSPVKNSTVSGS